MRSLAKPIEVSSDVFETCISRVSKIRLKKRLSACRALVIVASVEFESKVSILQLHTIKQESIVNGNVTAKELEKVYKNGMAKKGSPGRYVYDKLLAAPAHGICPLCSQRIATTLDHHLPKALYPRLSVVPVNLVPSCTDCNKLKRSKYPVSSLQETLHPYFDKIENVTWLDAKVIQTSPPIINYFVKPHVKWDSMLKNRVKNHFESLSLNKLYSSNAASEIVEIKQQLDRIYDRSGKEGVKFHLKEGGESRAVANVNSWRAVMYRTLSNDLWFCDKGWR